MFSCQKVKCRLCLVWLCGLSTRLRSKGSLVRFPVRAYAWIAVQVPSWGCWRGNHILIFLSLSFSLLSPLSKNRYISKYLKKRNANFLKKEKKNQQFGKIFGQKFRSCVFSPQLSCYQNHSLCLSFFIYQRRVSS